MAHWPEPLLLGIGRRGWNEEEYLVRPQVFRSAACPSLNRRCRRQLVSLFLVRLPSRGHLQDGDRLRAILILDHQGGAAAFLYRAVRHA